MMMKTRYDGKGSELNSSGAQSENNYKGDFASVFGSLKFVRILMELARSGGMNIYGLRKFTGLRIIDLKKRLGFLESIGKVVYTGGMYRIRSDKLRATLLEFEA